MPAPRIPMRKIKDVLRLKLHLSACAIRVTCRRRKVTGLDLFAKSIADSLVEALPVTPPRS